MNRSALKTWVYRAGLILGAGIFVFQLVSGLTALRKEGFPAGFWAIVPWSIAGMLLVVFLQIVNWQVLLGATGVHLSLKALVQGYVLSSLPKYIPGSIWGYLGRSQWLLQDHGVAFGLTNLANLFEIEVTLVSALGVVCFGLGINSGRWLYLAAAVLIPAAVLLLTGLLIRFIFRKGWFGLAALAAPPLLNFRFLWLATLVSALEWLILGAVILLLIQGTAADVEINFQSWLLAVNCFTLAWLAGFFILFVPGGLGVREAALVGLILANFPASYEAAALAAVCSRLFYSSGELAWLGIGFLFKKRPTGADSSPK